jgi:hypothetical protein
MAHLRKRGLLVPGTRTVLSWQMRGRLTGSINFRAFEDRVELRFACGTESVLQEIAFVHTPTNFGGRRKRFECPHCWRACDVLYGGFRFRCRKCHRLTYQSQYDAAWERRRSRAEKIRTKLGQPGFITPYDVHRFPDKPKRMRWQTYERMRNEDARLMAAHERGFIASATALIDRFQAARRR